ncbi:unnamed protein product, partial [Discosporangium mesarthrocarpum]
MAKRERDVECLLFHEIAEDAVPSAKRKKLRPKKQRSASEDEWDAEDDKDDDDGDEDEEVEDKEEKEEDKEKVLEPYTKGGRGDRQQLEVNPSAILPGKALRGCNGFDIMRKGSRSRGKRLLMLPGSLGLSSGGKLGTLKDVTSTSPILYVEFPEGRLKCTSRTVHTKGRFFTLYADKAGSRASRMDCRDVFDAVTFFTKAEWVGTSEENPEEDPLPLPASLEELPFDVSGQEKDFQVHFGGGNPIPSNPDGLAMGDEGGRGIKANGTAKVSPDTGGTGSEAD